MYPIPPTEKLVETKICRHCNASFPITDKDLEFYEKVSPVFSGKKYSIPTPTLCPDCRQQRRLSFRNERKLYKRKCDATGRDIVSIYSPDKPFKVYHQDFWWSDKWDAMEYGRDFDFGKGFFEQFGELIRDVPQLSVINMNPENSEYTSGGVGNEDCYMIFCASNNEDCYNGFWLFNSSDLLDCHSVYDSFDSYECVDMEKSSRCFYSERLENCSDCYSCSDCIGCTHCIDCNGLNNASYMIGNIKVSPEQFDKELTRITKTRKQRNFLKGANTMINCENVIGDGISATKNGCSVFGGKDGKDIKYVHNYLDLKDSYDINSQAYDCTRIYESYGVEHIHASMGIFLSANVDELLYGIYCFATKNSFGCFGLQNKSYCILNKQYTKEEYEVLVPKIIEHMKKIGEWGEFFPSSISLFGYNETAAHEVYPLTKEEINKNKIFHWSDYEAPFPKVEKIIPASKLPNNITEIPDDILNWAIECEVTKKPFRIIKQELEFYRKHNLPIPRRHPDQRHLDRMALRNSGKLFKRKCDKCGKEMITTYSPERPEKVYCETCYNKEVM